MAAVLAKIGLRAAPYLEKYGAKSLNNPETKAYLKSISKHITLENANTLLNHAQQLSDLHQKYKTGTLQSSDIHTALNVAKSLKSTGGKVDFSKIGLEDVVSLLGVLSVLVTLAAKVKKGGANNIHPDDIIKYIGGGAILVTLTNHINKKGGSTTSSIANFLKRVNLSDIDFNDILKLIELGRKYKSGELDYKEAASTALNLANKIKLKGGGYSKYLSYITKYIDFSKLDMNDIIKLLEIGKKYKDGTIDYNELTNDAIYYANKLKTSGSNYEVLNKKGGEYINRIQKEFRNKLNLNYYKLISGGTSKKALKVFNRAGVEYGDKLINKYLSKLENHAIKGGHSPHVVRNLLTKYGGTLPSKLNRLIKRANKKIEDSDKKLKMVFNARNYMGGDTKVVDFSDDDAVLSEEFNTPATTHTAAMYKSMIAPSRRELVTDIEYSPEVDAVVTDKIADAEARASEDTEIADTGLGLRHLFEEDLPEAAEPNAELPPVAQGADLTDVTATPELIAEINQLSSPAQTEQQIEILPEGWFSAVDGDGDKYYYTADGQTSWTLPTSAILPDTVLPSAEELAMSSPTSSDSVPAPAVKPDGTPLPPGWFAAKTPAGDTYYYNNDNKQSWIVPEDEPDNLRQQMLEQPTEQALDLVEAAKEIRQDVLGQPTEQAPDNDFNTRLNNLQSQLNKLRNNSDSDSDSDKSIKINFKPIITMTMNGSDEPQKKNVSQM